MFRYILYYPVECYIAAKEFHALMAIDWPKLERIVLCKFVADDNKMLGVISKMLIPKQLQNLKTITVHKTKLI